ncbi:hypothetical protein [Nocardiopsis potens]|uniref:hypothetical protein n=1 Tax=Nocardiopsis potens TaxID=1246458 RepID=UPI00034A47D4|nr:hypothetical protein [Nocardiopsis potens]
MRAITAAAARGGAGALLALGLLTGCGMAGGDQEEQAGGGAKSEEERLQEARLEFARCMRDNGVDMPDPGGADGMVPGLELNGETEKALEACEEKVPMDEFEPSEEELAEMHEKDLELAECLRGEGIDVEDPKKGQGMTLPADADGMEEAMEACGQSGMSTVPRGGGEK